MAEGSPRLTVILYIVGTVLAIIGVIVATIEKFIGVGIILVAIALFLVPMTRPRY